MPAKTPKHSPLPWILSRLFVGNTPGQWAVMSGRAVIGYVHAQKTEDAALIVRAVNSHDAMVEAAELAHAYLLTLGKPGLVVDKLIAALKLAEGE